MPLKLQLQMIALIAKIRIIHRFDFYEKREKVITQLYHLVINQEKII